MSPKILKVRLRNADLDGSFLEMMLFVVDSAKFYIDSKLEQKA